MTTTTAILLKHLDVRTRSGFEWLCLCPYHEDKSPSFSVNIRKRLFICYACGAKGNMTQLLQHLGVSEKPEQEEVSLDELTAKIKGVNEDVSRTERPPVGVPIPPRIYSNQEEIAKYWNQTRHLPLVTVETYGLGFDELANEAIIPVRDFNGHNIGIIRRTFDPSRPRYLYSKGMKTSEVVFGAYEAKQLAMKNNGKKGILVITEGSVDAMTVYNLQKTGQDFFYAGVALLGSRISSRQAEIIKRLGYEKIIIATDMDRAGKTAQVQVRSTLKSINCGALIYDATWDESLGKDLNSLPFKNLLTTLYDSMAIGKNTYAKMIVASSQKQFTSTNSKSRISYNWYQ